MAAQSAAQREERMRESLRCDVAAELWGAALELAGCAAQYGTVLVEGYQVESSTWPDAVRVSHKLAEEYPGDPDRRSSDERWRIRLDTLDGYARVLEAASWTVERPETRGGSSEPWLIVRRGAGQAGPS